MKSGDPVPMGAQRARSENDFIPLGCGSLIQAVEQLRLNAWRSLLTALGIIIAVAGAIAIIGVMQGAQENI